MRSKEVDLAIKNFENYDKLISIYRPKDVTIENPQDFNKDVETILNYISELEKENEKYKNFQLHISGMRSGKELLTRYIKDSILKDKIRDKIKELDDYYKKEVYPIRYQWADIDITEFYDSQIELLNELLVGE